MSTLRDRREPYRAYLIEVKIRGSYWEADGIS